MLITRRYVELNFIFCRAECAERSPVVTVVDSSGDARPSGVPGDVAANFNFAAALRGTFLRIADGFADTGL